MSNKARVETILKKVFPKLTDDNIDESWGPNDIEGWDSLNHLNLVMEINKEFNINLEFDEVMSIEKVSDIITVVEKYNSA